MSEKPLCLVPEKQENSTGLIEAAFFAKGFPMLVFEADVTGQVSNDGFFSGDRLSIMRKQPSTSQLSVPTQPNNRQIHQTN